MPCALTPCRLSCPGFHRCQRQGVGPQTALVSRKRETELAVELQGDGLNATFSVGKKGVHDGFNGYIGFRLWRRLWTVRHQLVPCFQGVGFIFFAPDAQSDFLVADLDMPSDFRRVEPRMSRPSCHLRILSAMANSPQIVPCGCWEKEQALIFQGLLSCGEWTRTTDLQVMSLASYRCSTPRLVRAAPRC